METPIFTLAFLISLTGTIVFGWMLFCIIFGV